MYENNIGSGLSAPVRESEMVKVLSSLHKAIEYSQNSFSELETRISPILRDGSEVDISEVSSNDILKVPGYSSSLAQEINLATLKIENLASWIRKVKNRIEL